MAKRIDPTRCLRGKTGNSRGLARALFRKSDKPARCRWEAIGSEGQQLGIARSAQALTAFFGKDVLVRRIE